MEAPRLPLVTSDTITPPWMEIGAVAAGPGMLGIKAMFNWVERVRRVVSLARSCIMPVAVAGPRVIARAGALATIWAAAVLGRRHSDQGRFPALPIRAEVVAVVGAAVAVPVAPVWSSWPIVARARQRLL